MIFSEGNATATINRSTMIMAEATAALLSGRIGFRDYVANGQPATIEMDCFEYPCYRCNRISLIWQVNQEVIQGPCGTTAAIRHASIWANERPEANSAVRQRAAAEAKRLRVAAANLGRRHSQTAGGSYTAFSCPNYGSLFGDWFLREYIMEAQAVDGFTGLTLPSNHYRIGSPHWCIDSGSGLCPDLQDSPPS
jgi:hypothetical protein